MIRYVHTNLIAKDWRKLAAFYETVLECTPIPPERNMSGEWLDKATGIENARIRGMHLRMPGYSENGPTLEIFEYGGTSEKLLINADTPGFSHIAFSVDDVENLSKKAIKHGASIVGELTKKHIENAGEIVFQYLADPEGNIIELQSWTNKKPK